MSLGALFGRPVWEYSSITVARAELAEKIATLGLESWEAWHLESEPTEYGVCEGGEYKRPSQVTVYLKRITLPVARLNMNADSDAPDPARSGLPANGDEAARPPATPVSSHLHKPCRCMASMGYLEPATPVRNCDSCGGSGTVLTELGIEVQALIRTEIRESASIEADIKNLIEHETAQHITQQEVDGAIDDHLNTHHPEH